MTLSNNRQSKRIIIITVCSLVLAALIIAVVIGFTTSNSEAKGETTQSQKHPEITDSFKAIKSICQPTDFKQTCEEQLGLEAGNSTDIKDLIRAALRAGVKFATQCANNSTALRDIEKDPKSKNALENCKQLLTYSIYELQKSIVHINELDVGNFNHILEDIKIWLSATITNQHTCLDGFDNMTTVPGEKMKIALNVSMKLSRLGLAIAGELFEVLKHFEYPGIRRRQLEEKGHTDESMLDDNPWEPRFFQERDAHVLGHSDWSSMMDKKFWKHHATQGKNYPVLGHAEWSSMLDESNLWKRRLLQETKPRRLLQEEEVLVVGHVDDELFMLNKQRLLQAKEAPVVGQDDQFFMLHKRRLLHEKESPVHQHAYWSSVLETDPLKFRLIDNIYPSKLNPDIVVAKDGSGNFKTIKDAMSHIPLNAQNPFVIYIKEGIYEENIIFSYNMTNIALIGDGKDKTRITGSLNVADGLSTFNTATVAVNGDFFFAKNIGFENTAGAIKLQAVALMVISDFTIFYNCSIDGYEDTLYIHSKRQFYRDCTVSGTIDFVFGDAAAVFQNCKFLVRKPLKGEQNTVTAQGRSDELQPTGIVIQNSTIGPHDELIPFKNEHPTFLGRPWGNYSRTIIMETFIDDLIKPAVWDGSETSYYSEYNNRGPGSITNGRVTSWSAVKKLSRTRALGFTPGKFFLGDYWIKHKGVPYTSGFTEGHTSNINMDVRSSLVVDK